MRMKPAYLPQAAEERTGGATLPCRWYCVDFQMDTPAGTRAGAVE